MPSGHPKDPVATRAKMRAAAAKRAAKRQEDVTKARQLASAGYNHAAISAEMGISASSVRSLMVPAPIRKHTAKKRTTAEKEAMRLSDEALAALREKLTGDSKKDEVAYGRELEFEIESLKGQLRTEQGVVDELRDKLIVSERRLATVLDLVARTMT